jgi:acid phosphatase type 7
LGDVVYYAGESANYWPEFYEPYLNYNGPIVAIPGNHDGDVNPATNEISLQAFVRNFCAQSAVISPDNLVAPRRTMTQPNVFWTLNTPLVSPLSAQGQSPRLRCRTDCRSHAPRGSTNTKPASRYGSLQQFLLG